MFGVTISTRKPRSGEYELLEQNRRVSQEIAGMMLSIKNNRQKPVYLKWRI